MATKKTNAKRAPEPVTEAAARVSAELTELGARFALVGGLAVSVWGLAQGSSETQAGSGELTAGWPLFDACIWMLPPLRSPRVS